MDENKDQEQQEKLGQVGSVEVTPLSDEDLESASGGDVVIIRQESNAANACCNS
jgi:hypothetical protein